MHKSFLSQNIFYDSKRFSMTVKAFLWFLCQVELENKKTKVSTRMKTKMLMSFKTVYLFQQKPVNKKNKSTKQRGMPYNKSFIDQVSSVKIAWYWSPSFLAFLWTFVSENLTNIQPSWPPTWSIINLLITSLFIPHRGEPEIALQIFDQVPNNYCMGFKILILCDHAPLFYITENNNHNNLIQICFQ